MSVKLTVSHTERQYLILCGLCMPCKLTWPANMVWEKRAFLWFG